MEPPMRLIVRGRSSRWGMAGTCRSSSVLRWITRRQGHGIGATAPCISLTFDAIVDSAMYLFHKYAKALEPAIVSELGARKDNFSCMQSG